MNIGDNYSDLLKQQINKYGKENRFLEFKSNHLDAEQLGRTISALSNGACLDREDYAYLYFGVDDETLAVKGTTFDVSSCKAKGNQSLELYLRQYITPKIDFTIEEFRHDGTARVVVFRIPAAKGEPTSFMKKAYVRVDSNVTELAPYADWMRTIYMSHTDWTAQVVDGASIDDLDEEAVSMVREGYKKRSPDYAADADKWDDGVLLDKAGLTQDGMITRAAMLLVGKNERAYKLGHIAQLVWKCHQDGETFGDIYTIPFIKSTTILLNRIRNYRFKIFPDNMLIPVEIWKYDSRSILEGLHNCIAHQDYGRNERIVVTEDKDKLTFENAGSFYDGDYTQYIFGKKTPTRYRNPFLMKAMVNVKMIDSQGYGIHQLFERQRERYLPMPDYDDSTSTHVIMHLPGTVIDEDFSLTLMNRKDVTLDETVLLDQLQKGKGLNHEGIQLLKKKHLIEGRHPHYYIAKSVAQATDRKAEYSQHKGLGEKACTAILIDALREHGPLSKGEISKLLWTTLSDMLTDEQKENKIDYILKKMRIDGKITNKRAGSKSEWMLTED